MKRNELYYDISPPNRFHNFLNNLDYHFITNLTLPALLHYQDRSSMAHSVESRVPFLDFRLVEFGVNLQANYLASKHSTRPLFKKALSKYLPKQINERKDKLGYPVPFAEWTRKRLKKYVIDSLTNNNARMFKYLDRRFIEQNLKRHFNSEIDYSWEIWRLLSFEKFLELIH